MLDFIEYRKYSAVMAKKKVKMGRPPLKEEDRRNSLVTLRLTKKEHKDLEYDADSKDLSMSAFLIECWKKVRSRNGKRK